jgi:hypothetical protein
LDCAKGGKADQAGALAVALKNKGLKELYEQCEKDVANCHPASDWQNCSIVSNIIKTYKVALQCNRRLDARQTTSREGSLLSAALIPLVLSRIESILIYLESVGILDTRHSELAADPSNSTFYFIKLQS